MLFSRAKKKQTRMKGRVGFTSLRGKGDIMPSAVVIWRRGEGGVRVVVLEKSEGRGW